ncbi:MAG TPA: hypothetical protein PKC13_15985 [Blastocatellia bacterium]|nr:hypothetical protein [Blastocatellia bacterium]HMX27101.1 hypothetical protein [Blastocatellia bacterium]HNG32903.1 hypothetical protein [Blastocatellia bacterium]
MTNIAIESEASAKTQSRHRWKAALMVAVVCVVLTSFAVLPFFVIGEDQKIGCCGGAMPVTHDAWMHYNQMNAFWQSLSAGIVYPRWDENTHGYGAPTTSFYPPGVYYLTSAAYLVTRDWVKAWAGFYWLTMLASAAAIYWYARQHLSHGASMLATAVYVFAPYHLLNQYQRGAMSEFTSFIWIPLCLLFAERLLDVGQTSASPQDSEDRLKSVPLSFAGLAASFGAFLWTHPPTAYQFALVFGICFAWEITRGRVRFQAVIWVVAAMVFGSMLAAAYFYPAIAERQLVNYDDVERTWPYHASYVFDFSQTVYDHVGNPFFVRLDWIWAFNLIALLIVAAAALRFGEARLRRQVWLWTAAGLPAAFLMTKYSAPVGRWIPKIELGVFSWRLLSLSSFVLAMLVGAIANCGSLSRSNRWRGRESLWIADWRRVVAGLMLMGVLMMSGGFVVGPMWRGQAFEPNQQHYNYATLPRGAVREAPPMPPVQLTAGKGHIVTERWTPEFRQLRVELVEADQLQFSTRNFAGWTATVDGRVAPIREGAIKNILVDLPAGSHQVTLEFRSTPVRRLSNWLTVLSFVSLVLLVLFIRRK